jgi:hypothetical protein
MENIYKIKPASLLVLLFRSAGYGVAGFLIFYLLISLLKYFQFVLGITSRFSMDMYDVFISAIGFVLMFLINFLKFFTQDGKEVKPAEEISNQ